MATIKIKFRPSVSDGEQGIIYYQIIHNRVARQQKTGYRLYEDEWNSDISKVIFSVGNEKREYYLSDINDKIQCDIKVFQSIISDFEKSRREYTTDDIIEEFNIVSAGKSFFSFMKSVIVTLKTLGKIRTSETYTATLSSLEHFREYKDVTFDELDSDMMIAYEAYLRAKGVSPNSSSFYMRNARAVYNRAVEKGLTCQRYPFKHVYTGVDKTLKRAISLKIVKKIKEMDLSGNLNFDFARDMFLFSFYTRGMSFVDMSFLRKRDLQNGVLSYRRRKTGRLLLIKWEKCMQEIVDKYDTSQSLYLLSVINPQKDADERTQYLYAAHNINKCLKIIGAKLGLSAPLTLYVARHAWASIARSKNVPISVISEGMGHDSESTTRIYLASLDTVVVDKVNSMIIKSL